MRVSTSTRIDLGGLTVDLDELVELLEAARARLAVDGQDATVLVGVNRADGDPRERDSAYLVVTSR